MSSERLMFKLSPAELSLELGEGATRAKFEEQADLVSSKWEVGSTKPKQPFLLMLGGFQGSGKTSVLELLKKDFEVLVISPDQIRYNLFSQNYPFSEDFVRLVNATRLELTDRALKRGQGVVVDQAITPDRIKMMKERLLHYSDYRLVTVFLTAPDDVLKRRVSERSTFPGQYKGTVPELEASMKRYKELYGEPQDGEYDLIVDTSKNDPQQVKNLINLQLS